MLVEGKVMLTPREARIPALLSRGVSIPEDRGSSRELDIKILVSKQALSVFGNHPQAFDASPASSSFGLQKLVRDLYDFRFSIFDFRLKN